MTNGWIDKYDAVPCPTADDPRLTRQFIVDGSWGVRSAYFQHNWGSPHFQDVDQHVDEGDYHEDEDFHPGQFKVYQWQEMPDVGREELE